MKGSKILSMIFATVFAVSLFACGGGAKTEEATTEPEVEVKETEPTVDTTAVAVDTVSAPVDTVAVDSTAN